MRPAIDISHGLHGRLKDYAEANDLALTEAYRQILESGLDSETGLSIQSHCDRPVVHKCRIHPTAEAVGSLRVFL
ncbi:MAG: hypothetical protein A07HR60_02852 [uncultured archaeon A07HR60]|nr:MAG: hypothetical protein A07HR60_02852 [uncultured archaeon A07HR60]